VDCNELFTSTMKLVTIRLMRTVATLFGWKTYQMDVKSTFLDGDLEEDVTFPTINPMVGTTLLRGKTLL
jgi:hypothetical protein